MDNACIEPRLRIGEVARKLGLNPKTIRYYEEIGLLTAPSRSETGYRLYTGADLDYLRFIIKAKNVGLTLSEIGDIVSLRRGGEMPCEHVVSLLDDKLASIEQQLRALKEFQDDLSTLRSEAAQDTSRSNGKFCWIIEQHASSYSDVDSFTSTE